MDRRSFLLSASASALLVACSAESNLGSSGAAGPSIPSVAPATLEALIAAAHGFWVGSPMATTRMVVFFDPQCPHCGNLWRATEGLRGKARMLWVPVAILNRASATQGSAILVAPNSEEKMTEHESLLSSGKGGISAVGSPDQGAMQKIKSNSELFKLLQARSVPLVYWADHDGRLVSEVGPSLSRLNAVVSARPTSSPS